MTKNKLLILLVVVLLATNIALLVYLFNRPGRSNRRQEREAAMAAFVQKELGFGEEQLSQYDNLAKQHRQKTKGLMDSMRQTREQELQQLAAAGFSDSAMQQSVSRVTQRQTAMALLMLQHYKNVRQLCTAEQRVKFDSGYHKLWPRQR
jgi:hypothetical protein